MSDEIVINIGRSFTRFPLGRHAAHGEGSGEEFRESVLIPALKRNPSKLVIELDDALGYGSSFLDEAFGGLVRAGFEVKKLLHVLSFVSEDPSLVEDIVSYISEARAK